ncbi:MAG TPA: TIGR02300 family protein [Alphaproteobacteria bacterium]|nr:TIGR02300 family protein [Alphaproteobacteria bacterium]
MANPKWGQKCVCSGCQAPFYDMQRSPVTCPKCGAFYQPSVLLKSDGRPRRRSRLPVQAGPSAAPEELPVHSGEPDTADVDQDVIEDDETIEAGSDA